ncbi:MAG: class I SAM-dependent methyltransferase [Deltaproteobacteria bacterium]|nr:class I SAM-dependent methyltransferase [Deltaproteobacteria bacterium]
MKSRTVNLSKYAAQYDNMARFKPSYHEVQTVAIDYLLNFLQNERGVLIEDAGAGTGEFSKRLARRFPQSKIYAVELNLGFYEKLCEKVKEIANVEVVNGNIESKLFPDDYFDAIVMIHVLNYTEHARCRGRSCSKEGL